MKFGSLFSGIGGLDLGLERAGMICGWQVELDDYCNRVLEKHWPKVKRYGDVKEIKDLEWVDLICGGFPCQPVSVAGKRQGTDDSRWLWPEFARIIRMVRPRYALIENVPGLLSANNGGAMSEILGDLASLGYDAEWDCVSAESVGAPHLRWRVFIVAYCNGGDGRTGREGRLIRDSEWETKQTFRDVADSKSDLWRTSRNARSFPFNDGSQDVAESEGTGLEVGRRTSRTTARFSRSECESQDVADAENSNGGRTSGKDDTGRRHPEAGGCCLGRDRLSHWSTEPNVGRVAHGVPSRVDRLKALGNAVVPLQAQRVAEWVGRRIIQGD